MNKSFLPEDWVVVILGFIIIAASLGGIIISSPEYSWENSAVLTAKILSGANLLKIGVQFIYVMVIALAGAMLTGKSFTNVAKVFPMVYVLTVLALIVAGSSQMKALNLEAVIFSLAIGLLIGNTFKLPQWFKDALASEFYVKIGLVLLGTSIIFSDILKAGSLGLIQALIVVISVWYFSYWVCKKLKIDSELTMMLSSAVSICGVSAAIATSGAIKGDSKKLSLVISLVLITAVPMMVFMPYLAKLMDLSQEVTGAWLGGSIDTTGAVVASGSLVGETALKISSIVKFSQNVLLGLAAFAISVYWTYTKHPNAADRETKPTLGVIWERFPKFVIGFIAASLLFSLLIPAETAAAVKNPLKNLQGLWFALAFTSIGLETNFRDLINKDSRKPVYAFLIAQGFNVVITLVIAMMLFR
ncbi:putative sulfate exporter family transporter [Mucilaginibacter pallidiroseus]|uniref:Putative sulfate exporter family transporter n=1 Tax=Mucilaginibacter pallidiroseus TaxID=2599295 RepID=A0A563UDL8_9SPHI|nr:putative sulfate exporter family transporter [Mucilaginibacter pallidiroseus]TWR29455.1 putative sulfate exporter family transporter [Mucilaginibacter pallidiroseus]